MSDLIHIPTPRALADPETNLDVVSEAIATNISGGLGYGDLSNITISSGTNPRLNVPTLEGEETVDRITCVIVFVRYERVYYKVAFGKGSGKQLPDCISWDGVTGKGRPGGECLRCPFAEYGSAEEGAGQACRQIVRLFVLRGDRHLPEVVSLPPTSVKPVRQFLLKLTTQGIPYHQALISLELEKAQNSGGIAYGKALLKFIRLLTPEETGRARRYQELCRSLPAREPNCVEREAQEQLNESNVL